MRPEDELAHLVVLAAALGTTVAQLEREGSADDQERQAIAHTRALALKPIVRVPPDRRWVCR
jgi:hypothetical protein